MSRPIQIDVLGYETREGKTRIRLTHSGEHIFTSSFDPDQAIEAAVDIVRAELRMALHGPPSPG